MSLYLRAFWRGRTDFLNAWTFGGLANAPRFNASSGLPANFSGSFAQSGKLDGLAFGIIKCRESQTSLSVRGYVFSHSVLPHLQTRNVSQGADWPLVGSGRLSVPGASGDSILIGDSKQFPQIFCPVFRCLQNPLSATNSYFRINRRFDSDWYKNAPSTRHSMASDATNDRFWVLDNAGNPTSAHQSQRP